MKSFYIKREIENKLISLSKTFPAIALTGPRQSGKSTLLKHIFSKTHKYITFDDPTVRERAIKDPKLFIGSIEDKAIIDEIQYVPEILSYLKISIDENRNKKGRFLLTGSQQFIMIKNLGDSLAGRIALMELLPFNIMEKNKISNLKNVKTALGSFIHSCLVGSFPEVAVNKKIDVSSWYSSYISTYLERDIKAIYDVGSLRDFHRFIELLASRSAQVLNLSSFANDIGVSVNTIKSWISILEASRIIFLLPPYYENLGKRITKSPKIYFLDCGLVCYLVGIHDKDHLLKGPMAGALFETFCVQETVKIFLNQGKRPEIYYIRTHNDLEIDLIIKGKNNNLYPFEIKFTKTPKTSMTLPIQRFKTTFSKLKIADGNVISLSEERFPLIKGVSTIGLNEYLSSMKEMF